MKKGHKIIRQPNTWKYFAGREMWERGLQVSFLKSNNPSPPTTVLPSNGRNVKDFPPENEQLSE